MPARRKRNKLNGTKKFAIKARLYLIVLLFLVFFLVFMAFRSMSANSGVFTIAVSSSPDVHVWVVNLEEGNITKVVIPGDAEAQLAMQRGTLRVQSIWKLIESENLPGQILADTVMKTFNTPIDYWAGEQALKNPLDKRTDIPFFLRLRTIFLSKRKTSEVINLNETSVLLPARLPDGQDGYTVSSDLPVALLSRFSDSDISDGRIAVRLINNTGEDMYSLRNVVKTLEVLGAKVAPIASGETSDVDCVVKSDQDKAVKRIASVLNCKKDNTAAETFDVEIILGKKFLERF